MEPLHILLNKTPNKRWKGKQKERTQIQAISAQNPKGVQRGQRTNYVPKPPLVANNISNKEKEENLKKTVRLEKPSCNDSVFQKHK